MINSRIYNFDDVIGNFSTVAVIRSSVKNGSFPNFTIMSGDSGTGKSTCAEIVSLSLTCENPNNANPCLQCNSCKVNLASLQNRGNSVRVKKVNVADSNFKKDFSNIVNQIFKLETKNEKVVFILEEVHSLIEIHQTALLEEIDKLSENVYVILCTTKPNRLLEELRNRSITFRFSRLKSSESKVLLERILSRNKIALPSNIRDEIVKSSRGVPRVIVNLTDLIVKNDCSHSTIIQLLGLIDPKVFNLMLRSVNDIVSYSNYLNELLMDYSVDDLVHNFKKYLTNLHFLSVGVSTFYSNTTKSDKELANDLGKATLYKIQNLVYSSNIKEDCDFVFCLLKVRGLILTERSHRQGQDNRVNHNPSIGSTINNDSSINHSSVTNQNISHTRNSSDSLRDSSIYKSPYETSIESQRRSEDLMKYNQSSLTPININKLKDRS